jgi:para-aminobenzoate synthetase/4-amino-4-deoxychorismate lyase
MTIIAFRNGLAERSSKESFVCQDLAQTLVIATANELIYAFEQVDRALKNNQFVVFAFAYEASCLFESENNNQTPQAFMWIFNSLKSVTASELDSILTSTSTSDLAGCLMPSLSIAKDEYCNVVEEIQQKISNGEFYQLNFTFPLDVKTYGDPAQIFVNVAQSQPTTESVYIDTKELLALSWSPEMFLTIKDNSIEVRPMKGTAPRGKDVNEDAKIVNEDLLSIKNQAENVMIVDLMRNDLSRIAKQNSVKVTKLFEVETYKTLHQLTSTITATLKSNNLFDIFKSLFPSGSITGAPKTAAMKAIAHFEKHPRNLYTGTIGLIMPGDTPNSFVLKSNIAIRTLILDRNDQSQHLSGTYNVGSGITCGSDKYDEYNECLLKASFLCRPQPKFQLFETIACAITENAKSVEDVITNSKTKMTLHQQRMARSALALGFVFDMEKFNQTIFDAISEMLSTDHNTVFRLKLTLYPSGDLKYIFSPVESLPTKVTVMWAESAVDSRNPLLQHKTTLRDLYDAECNRAQQHGAFDSLFVNQDGEVTEGSRSNIFVLTSSGLVTPKLSSGVLPGVLREELISKGLVQEQTLSPSDVNVASSNGNLFIGNSLRGLRSATVMLKS